jgi:hypothetical protein
LVWNQLYDDWQFCFYLQNRLIRTNQTGGQWYNDTSPFSIPCFKIRRQSQNKDRKIILSLLWISTQVFVLLAEANPSVGLQNFFRKNLFVIGSLKLNQNVKSLASKIFRKKYFYFWRRLFKSNILTNAHSPSVNKALEGIIYTEKD